MPFKSSEIRWFSREKQVLWDVFENLQKSGPGNPEEERTDFYLSSNTPNSGIKIREGKHELKVKTDKDEKLEFGLLQHWSKWSYAEEENILNSVNSNLLDDWLKLTKNRAKKSYKITAEEKVEFTSEENIKEGFDPNSHDLKFRHWSSPALRWDWNPSAVKRNPQETCALRWINFS
ncbi:hypothetical protein RM545_03230 [Zunongwangia sp. F260]|uniref:Uncharacterized protein n=1 Tax=Autumnicola lenta TaxID=3075593 RepID=A0ABU3CH67_9FLAO|nr:hypothetical protein [Zunongwangia sp. F260]MDT0645692.1 hypothetical protein [Zunongwangia sp. F260]